MYLIDVGHSGLKGLYNMNGLHQFKISLIVYLFLNFTFYGQFLLNLLKKKYLDQARVTLLFKYKYLWKIWQYEVKVLKLFEADNRKEGLRWVFNVFKFWWKDQRNCKMPLQLIDWLAIVISLSYRYRYHRTYIYIYILQLHEVMSCTDRILVLVLNISQSFNY